jgi:hypothetical protein
MSAKQLYMYNRYKHGDVHRNTGATGTQKKKTNDVFETIDTDKNRFRFTTGAGVMIERMHTEARFFVIGALTLLSTFLLKDSLQALLRIYIYPLVDCDVKPDKVARSRRSRWMMLLVSFLVAAVSILIITFWPEPKQAIHSHT